MTSRLWPLLTGFAVWALAFVALYALQALGCIWAWPEPWHRTLLVAVTFASIIVLAILFARQWSRHRSETPPLQTIALGLTASAIAAAIIVFAPVLFARLCT